MRRRRKTKTEYSKKIMTIALSLNIIVILFSLYIILKTNDTSALAYLIPSVATEMAAGSAFYYSKAKAENKIKLMKSYKVNPTNEDFNNM